MKNTNELHAKLIWQSPNLKEDTGLAHGLGLAAPFSKGQTTPINNCWHFSSKGDDVDLMFFDITDFINGMNRINDLFQKYRIILLAFCLMDTHFHFVLHGDFELCNLFIREYIKLTSMSIRHRHGIHKALNSLKVSCQAIDNDRYLKTVIAYVCNNPIVANLCFNAYDYPWSSCALYFRQAGYWTSPGWIANGAISQKNQSGEDLIFPGEYIATDLVEKIYRTPKAFRYFMSKSTDEVESAEGVPSLLTIPIRELREHKGELCKQMFGARDVKTLNTEQRIKLARAMRAKYLSSPKQIARTCGLNYSEVAELI